ncbi:MAG TPA: carboxypeptidase-like regulatory domain-containing protein [Flavisolibacter sp.]|nr:carboxypeptidase-like regulatory domain-containing protein [Flavisolibacter sp.]
MRKLFLLTALILFLNSSYSQVWVSGLVKDNKTSVSGASITIKDSYDGAVTDSNGRFRFKTTEKGEQVLVVSAVGYKTNEQKFDLSSSHQDLTIVLKEEVNELRAVVITAGTFEASDRKRATVLSSIDIVTTASANADVTGAIKTLPGAQQVGEAEGLFVRGGTAAETKIFIDGTLVNNFFYTSEPNIATRGRFSPFIFKGTVFSAGGYSALYGQALSSALILESIDLPERSSATLSISPIGGSAGFQKLTKNKNASWGVNYGYTNVYAAFKILKTAPDYFNIPQYHSGDANFRFKTSRSGFLKYYGYFSHNKVGIRTGSLDSIGYKDVFRLKNFNMYHNLSWKESFGAQWKFNAGISYTNNKDDVHGSNQDENDKDVVLMGSGLEYKTFLLNAKGNYFNAKAVFEKRFAGLNALRFGSEYNFTDDKANYTLYNGHKSANYLKENLIAGFAETDVYLTNDLAAKMGARLENSQLLSKINIAPRVSLAYKLGKEGQASLAYGIFYQNPERRYLPSPYELNFAKATHYIAQYQKVTLQLTFRAEVFYKRYEDLLKTVMVNNQQVASSNNGYGYAKGFELFWRDRKTIKNFDYWISYSYLNTKRDFLNYPAELQPNFAAKHTANLVVKKFVTKLKTQFNANYVFATGRPYYNIQYDYSNSKYALYDQGKTIPYNSISLSVNYLPNVFKQSASRFTVFVFSVNNVLGNKQVFGYTYSYNGLRKEAIIPPVKTFIYLGAFLSFGVDRTQDVINSNL